MISIPIKLLISVLLGASIGLEREAYEKKVEGLHKQERGNLGVRSYALITTLGTIAAVLSKDFFSLYLIISITFGVLLVAYYLLGSWFTKDHGLTTDIAILWSYVIGVVIGFEALPIQLVVALVVCLILILSAKQRVQSFVRGIKQYELEGFIGFAIIALVVLPFLPDASYTLGDLPFILTLTSAYGLDLGAWTNLELINPFSVWKVVALITGVEIAGYVLEKTIGQSKGWLLTSVAGGFISSTSTTQSLAQQSKTSNNTNQLVSAAIFANLSSFLQHFILLASVNGIFLARNTLYIVATSLTALIAGVYFYLRTSKRPEDLTQTKASLERDHIFSLKPALQFAAIFMCIKIFTKLLLVVFGDGGFIVGNIIAALTGLDAVTINVSELAGTTISFGLGVITIILANAVNLFGKAFYAFMQGSREFALKFFISVSLMVLASLVGIIAIL